MHALNGGEQKVAGMFVDGFDPVNKTVYEILGCLFHGCLSYTDRQMFIFDGPYMGTQFDKRCKEDGVYKPLIDSLHPNREPLRPRDALYGERTNAVKLYHEVTEAEEIKYLDICSLYPYICKYEIFPIGHPAILTKEQIDMDRIREYEGLIKCMILPPSNLYHPVLPFRNDKGKLLFPLCRKCAENKLLNCNHNEAQRALVGTWTSIQIFVALDRGYRLLDVFEIWHFEEVSHYSNGDKTLFGDTWTHL